MSFAVSDSTELSNRGKRYRQWQQASIVASIFSFYVVVVVAERANVISRFDSFAEPYSPFFATFLAALVITVGLLVPYLCHLCLTLFIEKKFGFLRMDLGTSVLRVGKAVLYMSVMLSVAITFFAWMYVLTLRWWWLVVPLGFLTYRSAQTHLHPQWLKLFHDVRPLANPILLQRLESLEQRVALPIKRYYVLHIQGITSKANAWVSGISRSHKVILSDTLLQNCSADEIVAVIAHEFGHVKNQDVSKRLGILFMLEVGGLFLLDRASDQFLALDVDSLEHVAMFALCVALVHVYSRLFLIRMSRKQEERADAFALANSDPAAFSAAMRKLKHMNLITYEKKEEVRFSHPAMDERIRKADELAQKQAAGAND